MTLDTLCRLCTTPSHPVSQQHRTILNRYVEPLTRLMPQYGITTPLRQAHFLAQVAHESGMFKQTEENLKYSATRLHEVFPKYFKTEVEANNAAYNPERIANTVYANRLGNGTSQSGDGYRYRGRGLIQLTGKDNYRAFLTHLQQLPVQVLDGSTDAAIHSFQPLEHMAELVSRPELAVRSACWYWQHNKLNQIADRGPSEAVVTEITRRVNGGNNGLSYRKQYFVRAMAALK